MLDKAKTGGQRTTTLNAQKTFKTISRRFPRDINISACQQNDGGRRVAIWNGMKWKDHLLGLGPRILRFKRSFSKIFEDRPQIEAYYNSPE